MSTVKEAIAAIREVLLLADKVENAGELLSEVSRELRDHDRRLVRLETMVEVAAVQRLKTRE